MSLQQTEDMNELKAWFERLELSFVADSALRFQDGAISLESFFKELLNLIYGWDLVDANLMHSQDCYDLGDEDSRVAVQVTKDKSSKKAKETVMGFYENAYTDRFDHIILIYPFIKLNPRKAIRWVEELPSSAQFDYKRDRRSLGDLLRVVQTEISAERRKEVLHYVRQELAPLGRAIQMGVDQTSESFIAIISYMSENFTDHKSVRPDLKPDQKLKLRRFADHARFLLDQYKRNFTSFEGIALEAKEAVGNDAARAERRQSWLELKSLDALEEHDNNAKEAFIHLRTFLLNVAHEKGYDAEENAVGYLLAKEFIGCSVFPNPDPELSDVLNF